MITRAQKKLSLHLITHTRCEIAGCGIIYRYNNHSAQRAAENDRDPLGRIRPQSSTRSPLAMARSSSSRRESESRLGNLLSSSSERLVSPLLNVGALLATL